MLPVIVEPHYLPSLEYFCALLSHDAVILETNEHYVKQSFRNRCYINTTQGVAMLSVPLADKHSRAYLKDIRIDYSQKWQNNQWRTLYSAYANAPFFEHYGDGLHDGIFRRHEFLVDLNRELLSFCLKSLRMEVSLSESVSYEKYVQNEVLDLRCMINAKKPYSERSFYRPHAYYQVFGSAFEENLSVVDVLFCEGPQALGIIRKCSQAN